MRHTELTAELKVHWTNNKTKPNQRKIGIITR